MQRWKCQAEAPEVSVDDENDVIATTRWAGAGNRSALSGRLAVRSDEVVTERLLWQWRRSACRSDVPWHTEQLMERKAAVAGGALGAKATCVSQQVNHRKNTMHLVRFRNLPIGGWSTSGGDVYILLMNSTGFHLRMKILGCKFIICSFFLK